MKVDRQSLGTQKETSDESSRAENHMDALHRATLSLFSDLSLEGVLHRIIQAAHDLSGAQYAALGIPDGKGGLEAFITLGMTDEEIKQIPHQPVGHGLIGEMIRTGKSIRIPEISAHPRSVGFPSGHPRMRSFLGVPIVAYGRNLGQIYLTDKREAEEFTPKDQRLIEMLAAHAAAAIENARLYRQVSESEEELTQRNLELELVNSLATTTSSAIELDTLLEVMLERLITIIGAGAGEFYLREETEGGFYKALHRGEAIEALWEADRFRPGEGLVGQVAKDGKPLWTPDLSDKESLLDPSVSDAGFGSMVCVPLIAPGKVVGVLCLAFKGERVIDDREISLLEAIGAGVGIAVENARLNRRTRRLAVLEERERIGMDLHDGIIQSVYAVGLTLEYIRLQIEEAPEQAIQRLEQAIEDLDAVIGDLRSYILDLQPSRIEVDDLHGALERLIHEFKSNTLLDAELITEPEALEKLEQDTASELFLIAQEALANTAKHAFATKVWLSVRQFDKEVSLQVIDNGRGFDLTKEPGRLGHGLLNMSERARQIGGRFEIVSNPGDGTTITVHMPLDQDSRASQSPGSSSSVSAHVN